MKAKELMIGDWVRNALLNEVLKMNTTSMRNICWDEDNGTARYNIEPIPLTEEILKANGFARKPLLKSWTIDGELELIEDSIGNTKLEYWFSVSDQYICPIHHVHELQHAIRLCGLNELAHNFKIE